MNITIDGDDLKINILSIIGQLNEEQRQRFIDCFTWDVILESLDNHLKNKTDFFSYSGNGYNGGAAIREYILKAQGIEPEHINDLKDQIAGEKKQNEHYKKFYDWYFKVYHWMNDRKLWSNILENCGDPTGR